MQITETSTSDEIVDEQELLDGVFNTVDHFLEMKLFKFMRVAVPAYLIAHLIVYCFKVILV